MLTRSVLLAAVAAAATAVSAAATAVSAAELFPGHQGLKRALGARQTSSSDDSDIPDTAAVPTCIQPLYEIYASMPTMPPELTSVQIADPCGTFTLPPAVAAPYSSYSSEMSSWFGEHSADIFSALSNCPQITSAAGDAIASITGSLCEPTAAAGGDDGHGSSPNPTGNAGGNGGGNGGAAKAGAGALRETGFAGAAIAAAGFLGAVALL